MSEWKEVTLSECVSLLGDGLHGTPKYTENGEYAFINGNNFCDGKIVIKEDTKRVSEEEYLKYKKELNDRTLFVSINGTLGNVGAYNNEKVILGKSACYFNVKEDLDKNFIKYVVSTSEFKNYLEMNATGTTIKNVSLRQMRDYSFLLPPLAEQKRIAGILSSLDDKIEINNAINKNLEQQAQTLFDSVYDSSTDQVPLMSLISLGSGGTPRTTEPAYWNGNIPFFSPKDVGYPFVLKTEKYVTEEGVNNCNSKLYPANTTFITARGTVGKLSLSAVPMAMNQSCFALLSNKLSPFVIYMYAQKIVKSLKHKSNGAVFDAITTKDFESEIVNKIDEEKTERLNSILNPIFEKIQSNAFEIQRLTNLRDALLAKLMSGDDI